MIPLLFIGILIVGAITIILVNKNPKMKALLQVAFVVLIIVFGYLVVDSVMKPINFNKERTVREEAAEAKLKDIRKAQISYKDKYGKYTGSFDTLINFVKVDSFEIPAFLPVEGKVWNQDEVPTRKEALKLGILTKTTTKVAVFDSLFNEDYPIEEIRYIPYTNNEEFVMGAGEVETGSKVKVKVFEAYALYDVLFNGMDKQLVINYKDDRHKIIDFYGIKVGSLEEANNNAGNWEK